MRKSRLAGATPAAYEGALRMPATHSPTVRRRRLAAELRKLREAAQITCEEASERLECSPSKISRMETGQVTIHPRDVRELAGLYGATDEQTAVLIDIAREARKQGWWYSYYGVLPKLYLTFIGLEVEASVIRTYEAQYVPGLLQTEGYARALKAPVPASDILGETEKFVAARMTRQAILFREKPVNFVAVVDETVIRRTIGGPSVMREQLEHLAEAAILPHVRLHVLPFTSGAHAAMEGPFTILEFPDEADPDVIYVETLTSSLFWEHHTEIQRYKMVFDQVLASALDPAQSRELIIEAARALE
jgi:transcriptional regulator with XRE-family HTH domain